MKKSKRMQDLHNKLKRDLDEPEEHLPPSFIKFKSEADSGKDFNPDSSPDFQENIDVLKITNDGQKEGIIEEYNNQITEEIECVKEKNLC